MPSPLLVEFTGGSVGRYVVQETRCVAGEGLPAVPRLEVREGIAASAPPSFGSWSLRGVTSHQRYVERAEGERLRAVQAGLGRSEATLAVMIPIRKSAAWWDLAQDERRAIFEDKSRHIADTMKYLPAVARRLHHARDLGGPFDFVTWFELAPEHTSLFDDLLSVLRATEEWRYVEREVELRLIREG